MRTCMILEQEGQFRYIYKLLYDNKNVTNVLYISDGHRRFALKRGISLSEAYYLGGRTLKGLSQFFLVEDKANMLIYHALSSYTLKREDLSPNSVFEAVTKTFEDLTKENFFKINGIRFRVISHTEKLPPSLKKASEVLSDSTKGLDKKECVVLLGYSLEEEINQTLSQKPTDYESFRRNLIFPDIDLVIRSIEMRPSGGPIYAMSQAQMIILDKLNPEVSREDLYKAWRTYVELKEYRIKGNPLHHK